MLALLAVSCASCGRSQADWIRGLESPDLLERSLSALAVAEVAPQRGADALPRLTVAIDGRHGALSRRASEALVKIAPWTLDPMADWLADKIHAGSDSSLSLRAALATVGEKVLPSVARCVGAPGYAQNESLESLALELGAAAVGPLEELARSSPDPSTRGGAAILLGKLGRR